MASIAARRLTGADSVVWASPFDRRGCSRQTIPRRVAGESIRRGKQRALTVLERFAVVAVLLALVLCALASRSGMPNSVETTRIQVAAGDSLWRIAGENRIPGLTTAQTADLIARMNGLGASNLVPGTQLEVPLVNSDRGYVALD